MGHKKQKEKQTNNKQTNKQTKEPEKINPDYKTTTQISVLRSFPRPQAEGKLKNTCIVFGLPGE